MKQRVLFICVHNSARSQLAEALLRHLHGDRYESFSAGAEATRVRPEVLAVLAEAGIDATAQYSKPLDEFDGQRFDYAVTVCNESTEACPFFAGAEHHLNWDLDDPAQAAGGEQERLAVFRRTRDEVRRRIEETFGG